jgi:hypothetical protein
MAGEHTLWANDFGNPVCCRPKPALWERQILPLICSDGSRVKGTLAWQIGQSHSFFTEKVTAALNMSSHEGGMGRPQAR